MITQNSYPFLAHNVDKYERLIREAKTKEAKDFAVNAWADYNERFKMIDV